MNETVLRHVTHSHAALHTGLICVPTAIAVDPAAVAPKLPTIHLEEWLRRPEAPPRAVATCDLQDEEMLILITDAHTLQPVTVVFGPRALLGEFAAAFAVGPAKADGPADTDWRAVFYGRFHGVIDVKVGGGTGGGNPGPRVPDPTHVARNIAFAELASMPTIEIHARRGTPAGAVDR